MTNYPLDLRSTSLIWNDLPDESIPTFPDEFYFPKLTIDVRPSIIIRVDKAGRGSIIYDNPGDTAVPFIESQEQSSINEVESSICVKNDEASAEERPNSQCSISLQSSLSVVSDSPVSEDSEYINEKLSEESDYSSSSEASTPPPSKDSKSLHQNEEISDEAALIKTSNVIPQEKAKILPNSKTPVMDALAYCAFNKFSARVITCTADRVELKVYNWKTLLTQCQSIEKKASPTSETSSRLKSLRRWFSNVPHMKDMMPCTITSKPENSKKLYTIFDAIRTNLQKR